MFKNYITTALRNLIRNKLYSVINIGGLAIGLAACLLTILMIKDNLAHETFIPGAENIYQIRTAFKSREGDWSYQATQPPLKQALEDASSDFLQVTRLSTTRLTVARDGSVFYEPGAKVDVNFFEVFDLPFIQGSNALPDLGTVLISEHIATKYFGDANPLGQTLTLEKDKSYRVGGVFRDLPDNTHLKFELLIRLDFSNDAYSGWDNTGIATYVLTAPGHDLSGFNAGQPAFVDKYLPNLNPDREKISDFLRYIPFPLLDLHLYATNNDNSSGRILQIYAFAAVALLTLVIAGLNFVNLSMARAMTRAQEVSLRQILGAKRRDLIKQFLGETLLNTTLAMGIAFLFVKLALPWFNGFLETSFTLASFAEPTLIAGIIGLIVLVGIGAGAYPAFYISSLRPVKHLQANQSSASGSALFRNILITVQYAIAIMLTIVTGVIYAQTQYAKTMDIGLEKEGLIGLRWVEENQSKGFGERLKREVERLPGVQEVTGAYNLPTDGWRSTRGVTIPGQTIPDDNASAELMPIDYNFFEVFKATIIAGRTLSEDFATDTLITPENATQNSVDDSEPFIQAAVVLNETAVRQLGFPSAEAAVGTPIRMALGYSMGNAAFTVVGVVKDLHYFSAKNEVIPTIYFRHAPSLRHLAIRYQPGREADVAASLDALWQRLSPDVPVLRVSIEESYSKLYQDEDRQTTLFSIFSILAVVIASLGVFGIAVFTTERRTKEIGIRKIMGARVGNIVRLLTFQFSKPVLVALLIAWPLASYFMLDWLTGFHHRIDGWVISLIALGAGIGALMVAWITVAVHAHRAARKNPVNSLHYE